MASYNEGLHWTGEQGMGSWGSGGTDYCNFGYSNVSRNGTTVSFNWDTYIRQSTSQNYDRWAMTSNQLGVSNGTIKGHGSSWSQYPLGYYNYSNNNGASSTGGANSYGSAKSASVTVPLGQNYVDISVTYKNTGLNDGWVTPYGDSSTYPDVTKTFRISGVPLGTYTVSYNANGGTGAPGNQTKTHGTNLTLSSTRPTKANTTTSWSCALNANGGTSSTTSVSATATLVWSFRNWLSSSDNNTYNPGGTYSNNANTTMTAQWDSTGSATYTLPQASVFTKTGYTCIGFDSDPTATTPTYAPSDTVSVTANGGTLYAIYEANTYTVSYDANGGTGAPASQSYTYATTGDITLSSSEPNRAGHIFSGWATTSTSTTVDYAAGDSYSRSIANDQILYAVWEDSPYNKIAINIDGGLKTGTTYIKINNVWKIADEVFTKVSGAWKRAITPNPIPARLPDAYREVEYIQCTGTQYIDTGYKPNGATQVEVHVSDIAINGLLFGAYNQGWTTGYGMYCNANQDFWYHYYSNTQINTRPPTDFIMAFDKGKTYINGTSVASVSQKTFTLNYSMYLLAGNWYNTNVEQPTKCKLYYAKIYDSNTLVRDFIPCYRKSDGVIGLYDLVNDVFYTNAGTGVFLKGSNVYPGELPSTYEQVYGIQSTGTQFINTFYKPNQNTKTEISMESINLTSTLVPFGTRANQQLDYILGINFNSLNYIQYNTNTAIYSTEASTDLLNTKFIASLDKTAGTITYIDSNTQLEKTITMTPTTTTDFNCNNNLYLGCLNNNGNTQYLIPSYILYYCKIWENNQLIRDFIPCYRRTDNKVGLYDLTNNVFYDNAGSGNFTIVNEGRLPNTYQEVEYIGMSGAQYIDTHCALWSSSDWKIELSFDVSQNYDYNNLFGFGAVEDISHEIWVARYGEYYVRIANLSTKHQMFTASINTRYDMVHDNTGNQFLTYVNGTQVYSYNKLTTAQNYELWFGHRLNGAHLKGKVYSLKFWKDGALVRDFVPCYRKSDNEIGLYDLVEDTFYTNQGSGSFTKGSDV